LACALLGERSAWREGVGIALALLAVVGLSWEKANLELPTDVRDGTASRSA